MEERPHDRARRRWLRRFEVLHDRYGRLFWTLHSIWALLTGAAVLVLAHNRYGFLPWVILFLTLTWASALFFTRVLGTRPSRAFRFAQGFVSYLTRIMYQETLFFLIPFYSYSATFPSWNVVYVGVLATLAVLSCFDLLFDRLLRTRPGFAMAFFAFVTFSALNFFLPLFLQVRLAVGTSLAAGISFVAAIPLAYHLHELTEIRRAARIAAVFALVLLLARLLLPLVPPVPLRLAKLRFAGQFDAATVSAPHEFADTIPQRALVNHKLYAIATIFAPSRLRAAISLRFITGGRTVRDSRIVELLAHERGFRVWDALPAKAVSGRPTGSFPPGVYVVEVRTEDRRLLGRETVRVTEGRREPRQGEP
jgi:hypothetical protein